MGEPARTCPACQLAAAPDARYCSNCGSPLEWGAASAGDVSYSEPTERLFGVLAPVPTFVLATALLVGALVALVAESWILGVMLLAFAAALYLLFYGAAERDRTSGLARVAVDTVGRVAGWTRFATGSAGAWSGAGRRLYEIRRELGPLRRERREAQLALGEAAYRQDEDVTASLRARIAEIDEAIAARERERQQTLARARRRVEDERLEVRPTQLVPPDEPPDGAAGAPR